MKKDLIFGIIFLLIVLPFLPFNFLSVIHSSFLYNENYWYLNSFIKFALLATLGECLGLRLSKGVYYEKGFGILSRAFVWGFLGITIKIAFVVYAAGVPYLLEKFFFIKNSILSMHYKDVVEAYKNNLLYQRLLSAFFISTIMNVTYAPVLMVFHKITDTHIVVNNGKFKKLFTPIKVKHILSSIDWNSLWGFVLKKTIPYFWIPMQTINFLLPSEYRVVFAAFLGIILGLILSFASKKNKNK